MSEDKTDKKEEKAERETVLVELDALKEVVRETVEETVAERLKEAGVGKVDRSNVAVNLDDGKGEGDKRLAGQAGRATPAFEALYRGLPEWEQKIRTPDVDHHIASWAVGVMRNDHARMALAHDEIAKITGIRDLNVTSDSSLVPSPLANVIVEKKRKIQAIGPRSQIFVSESTTLEIPVEATFAAANGVAEGGTITPADPTWVTITLSKKKTIVATKSSVEFIEDNAFNAVNFLSAQAARTIALSNDAQDMRDGDGVGTNQTDALEEAGITEVDAAATDVNFGDLQGLWYALPSQYRANAVWLAGNDVIRDLSDILDGDGRSIFQTGMGPFEPLSGGQGAPGIGTIYNRPVLEVPATAGVLILGDLNFYGVLEHGSIRAEFSKDTAFLTDEVVWKWVQRRDGAVLLDDAFRKLGGIT